jgi:hypothetical protein
MPNAWVSHVEQYAAANKITYGCAMTIRMYECMYVRMYVCIIRMYVCVCVCMCIRIYVYTHTHTHTHDIYIFIYIYIYMYACIYTYNMLTHFFLNQPACSA